MWINVEHSGSFIFQWVTKVSKVNHSFSAADKINSHIQREIAFILREKCRCKNTTSSMFYKSKKLLILPRYHSMKHLVQCNEHILRMYEYFVMTIEKPGN